MKAIIATITTLRPVLPPTRSLPAAPALVGVQAMARPYCPPLVNQVNLRRGGVVTAQWRIGGPFWDRLRRWLPTPQDPGPDARPLPTPWRRAPDGHLRKAPGNPRSGLPA